VAPEANAQFEQDGAAAYPAHFEEHSVTKTQEWGAPEQAAAPVDPQFAGNPEAAQWGDQQWSAPQQTGWDQAQ